MTTIQRLSQSTDDSFTEKGKSQALHHGINGDRPLRLQSGGSIGRAHGVVTTEAVDLLTTLLLGCDYAESLTCDAGHLTV